MLDAGQSERGWHRLSMALKCPQLHAYKEILKLTMPETDPLVRGSLCHQGLAHLYRRVQALQEGEDPDQWYDPVTAMQLFAEQQDARPTSRTHDGTRGVKHPDSIPYAKHLQDCTDAVQGYSDFWVGYEDYRILGVEIELRALVPESGWSLDPLTTEFLITQRADLVVEDPDGYVYYIDHKTRGRKDNRAIRAYSRSGQFQGYQNFGRNAHGRKWGGNIINFITFGSKSYSYEREVPDIRPWRVQCFPDTVRYGERIVQDMEKMGVDPWKWPKVNVDNGCCEHRYGPCPAADWCDYGPGGSPEDETDKWGF
jgi:hypothetical protein